MQSLARKYGMLAPPWRVPSRRLALLAALPLIVAGFVAVRVLFGPGIFAQTTAWPTPPPGPEFPVPSAADTNAAVVNSVAGAGSEVKVIAAAWPGSLPLVPPIPSTKLTFDETESLQITLEVDAGTFGTAVQLRLTPVETGLLPDLGGVSLEAFTLEAFDMGGEPMTRPLQRPIKLEISVALLIAAGVEPRDLLFAIAADDNPQLIATTFRTGDLTVEARLAKLGTIYLVQDRPL